MDQDPGRSPSQPRGDEASAPSQKPAGAFSGLAHSPEFLETLAALGQPRSSDKPAKPKSRPQRSLLLAIAAVVALLLVLARDQGWRPWWEHSSVPEVFHGTWATSTERHADRGFVITSDSLQLLFGPGRGFTYPIVRVSGSPARDTTLFTFHYRDGAVDLTMRLHLEGDTTIHLVSLPMVAWTKQSR